jgi:hypothetical protein
VVSEGIHTPPAIQLPKKRAGLLGLFLHRTSRFQFYLLYSIMFALVLFLLVVAIDQIGNFGIIHTLQNPRREAVPVPPEVPPEAPLVQSIESELDRPSEPGHSEDNIPPDANEVVRKTFEEFEEHKKQQRVPLLRLWETFNVPEFLAVNFPSVQNDEIDVPEQKTFAELKPIYPFGSALELQFVPLFELSQMRVVTRRVFAELPDLVWQAEAFDISTRENTPMFRFQLTEAGLVMNWQTEGLNNQYLYDTVLSSLGFLQLNVAGEPEEAARQIPLFAPVQTVPMKVADLANLVEAENPEYVVELPFAAELWERVFAEMNPPRSILLDVQAEPAGDWVRIESSSALEFLTEVHVHTSQQIDKPTESGETFEPLVIPFAVSATLDNVVWKGSEYTERLRAEQEHIKSVKEMLGEKIEPLRKKAFEGDADAKRERDECEAELKKGDMRLKEIERTLEKLPAAYKEISQKESARFHYSVFLVSGDEKRKLLILTTKP